MSSAEPPSGSKRKRDDMPVKFYAVRKGHRPGIYNTYAACLEQVKGYSSGQFKSFASLFDAEKFMQDGPQPTPRFTTKAPKFYGVRHGFKPGVYTDWASTQQQINGFAKAKHKSFSTLAEAQEFVDDRQSPEGEADAKPPKRPKKTPTNVIDESIEPGSGPRPPTSEDGFDARIKLDDETGNVRYKTKAEHSAMKMQATGLREDAVLKIFTDGSSLGNGTGDDSSFAGVGIYFGPRDPRNASEPLKGPRQTNQRAELTAIQRAIEIAPPERDVLIASDSNYAIKCVTEWYQTWRRNGWKTANGKVVENRDLVELILTKIESREARGSSTRFQKVKGHANDPGNIAADALAVGAANRARATKLGSEAID